MLLAWSWLLSCNREQLLAFAIREGNEVEYLAPYQLSVSRLRRLECARNARAMQCML